MDIGYPGPVIDLTAKYSHRQLKKRDYWDSWLQAEFKQNDNYETQKMFGQPVPWPKDATVLPFVWSYYFKDTETRKACGTCNGGHRYGKAVILAYTYVSCIKQPAAWIFWALASIKNMLVMGADAGNAFMEAPPPHQQFYMEIDDQYDDWWMLHKKDDHLYLRDTSSQSYMPFRAILSHLTYGINISQIYY